MIVDTSAIIAILADEPEAVDLAARIEAATQVRVSAATVLEASLVCGPSRQRDLDDFLAESGASITPFDQAQLDLARRAHLQFGRGSGSRARLNYGDCFSYALAVHAAEGLLFVGDDFTHTDVPRESTASAPDVSPYRVRAHHSAVRPGVDVTALNRLADELDDDELLGGGAS